MAEAPDRGAERPPLVERCAAPPGPSRRSAHRIAILVATGLFVVVAGRASGATSPPGSPRAGSTPPSEQSVQAADVLASEFHSGSDNFILLVHARHGTVDSPAVAAAGPRADQAPGRAAPHGERAVLLEPRLHPGAAHRRPDERAGRGPHRRATRTRSPDASRPSPPRWRTHRARSTVQVGGFAAAFHEVNSVVEHDLLRAEAFAVPLTLILLLFVFGSLVAAAMPLTIGGVAVVGTLLSLRVLDGITPVSVFAVNLTTVLGLGLAIDYSLFVVSRFREELAAGRDVPDALEETLAHAGRTVAGSALTVAAAVSALLVFPLDVPALLRLRRHRRRPCWRARRRWSCCRPRLALIGHRINSLTVWRRSVRPPADGFWSRVAAARHAAAGRRHRRREPRSCS